jgi:hypothetical protein
VGAVITATAKPAQAVALADGRNLWAPTSRPVALRPEALLDDLARLGTSVLEIGPGTGHLLVVSHK